MKLLQLIIIIHGILGLFSCSNEEDMGPSVNDSIRLSPIPDNAEIIFHERNIIYAMDADGENTTQITFDDQRVLEHVAVSYDRTKIIANYFADPSIGGQSSKLLLYDITNQTATDLVGEFTMAGNGGVDWDSSGFIYFAGVSELPFTNPSNIEEFKANAAANDIYKVRYDGSGLQNLTNTINCGEADVSVSPDSRFISYMATNITNPDSTFTEIWKRDVSGNGPELLFVAGADRVSSVHDPEISTDGDYVLFSQVNNKVAPVFPNDPLANTAHDIIRVAISDINDVFTLTSPGLLSIIPDGKDNRVLYLEITDKTTPPYAGLAIVNSNGTGHKLIKNGANIGKWIP